MVMSKITIEDVFQFKRELVEQYGKFSVETQVMRNILQGYYHKVPNALETAKEDIKFMKEE